MYFTIRNTVILALTQVGVVVTGVLAAGACQKWYATFGVSPPWATTVVSEYGFLALALPLAWAVMALEALRRGDQSEGFEWFAFSSGIAVLLLLLLGVEYAAAGPWLRLIGGLDSF